jgi:hypothetical protein
MLATFAVACSAKKGDPPPLALSAEVPRAAPNARGSMIAGHAPVPGLATPRDPDDEDPEAEPPDDPEDVPAPSPPSTPDPPPSASPDSGVAL